MVLEHACRQAQRVRKQCQGGRKAGVAGVKTEALRLVAVTALTSDTPVSGSTVESRPPAAVTVDMDE